MVEKYPSPGDQGEYINFKTGVDFLPWFIYPDSVLHS